MRNWGLGVWFPSVQQQMTPRAADFKAPFIKFARKLSNLPLPVLPLSYKRRKDILWTDQLEVELHNKPFVWFWAQCALSGAFGKHNLLVIGNIWKMENFSQICFQESPPPLTFQRPLHNNKNKRFLFFYNFVKLSEAFGKHDLLVIENVGEIIFKYVSEKAPSLIFQRSLYNKPFLLWFCAQFTLQCIVGSFWETWFVRDWRCLRNAK